MVIHQVLNNNVVLSIDNGQELIIIGTGIGFQKKKGDSVDEGKIQSKYIAANNTLAQQMVTLIESTSEEIVDIVATIVSKAEAELETELNSGIYINLIDHIGFAIERSRKGLNISNGLLWDVKRMYKQEFRIGQEAVRLVNRTFDVSLSDDEAAYIAVHILNANYNMGIDVMEQMTKIIKDVVRIIEYYFSIDFDIESLDYMRLMNHLKFFAQRVLVNAPYEDKENILVDAIKLNYNEAYMCSKRIESYIKAEYDCQISQEELVYLSVHIQRLINQDCHGKAGNT